MCEWSAMTRWQCFEEKNEVYEDEVWNGRRWEVPYKLSRFALDYDKDSVWVHNQLHYFRKVKKININDETMYSKFHSVRMKLAWLASTCPDYLLEISQLAQVTGDVFKNSPQDWIKRMNCTVWYVQEAAIKLRKDFTYVVRDENVSEIFFELDCSFLFIIRYFDTSFAKHRTLYIKSGVYDLS